MTSMRGGAGHQEIHDVVAELVVAVQVVQAGAVALAWTLHQPGVAATIIGPRTREQLKSIRHVPEMKLNPEVLAELDAIFPPCGPAPEAYAW